MQNYRNLSSDLWAPSREDGREMNLGGSHDTAENCLFDLQAVAVQMVMFRLDALMGWFVLHPLMSDNNQHPFISNNTEASATSCDWILVRMSHRAKPILLPAALLPCWISSAWGLVCAETHQLGRAGSVSLFSPWQCCELNTPQLNEGKYYPSQS